MTWFGSAKDGRIRELEAALREAKRLIMSEHDEWRRERNLREAERHTRTTICDEYEQEKAALESQVTTLEARVEHQKAELAAVHHELVNQQQIATMTLELERDERRARQELMGKFVDGFVNLRRDGFNPLPAGYSGGVDRGRDQDDQPRAGELSADDVHKWLRCVELIQERAGGDAVLQSSMTGDAERWRALKIPFEEIENRIRDGYVE